jgi:hypothetical protein
MNKLGPQDALADVTRRKYAVRPVLPYFAKKNPKKR